MVNIGEIIKEEMQQQERSVSWLARKLNCNRMTVYRIMQKNSIDTGTLSLISIILKRNFFKELSSDTERRMANVSQE